MMPHGFGVLGETGGGALEHYALDQSRVPVLMATFGKACGAMGAFVAGPEEVVEAVIQAGRSYIYSTALPPALAVAATRSLAIITRETWRRERLHDLVGRFSRGAKQLDLPVLASRTPIQGFLAGSAEAAVRGSDFARAQGIWLNAIRPPTVPKNTERLRITLCAGHSDAQVDRLLDVLAQVNKRLCP